MHIVCAHPAIFIFDPTVVGHGIAFRAEPVFFHAELGAMSFVAFPFEGFDLVVAGGTHVGVGIGAEATKLLQERVFAAFWVAAAVQDGASAFRSRAVGDISRDRRNV